MRFSLFAEAVHEQMLCQIISAVLLSLDASLLDSCNSPCSSPSSYRAYPACGFTPTGTPLGPLPEPSNGLGLASTQGQLISACWLSHPFKHLQSHPTSA